ncbi:MAG TPA: hypothetical protein VHH33_08370 [Nitrososphaeraceae archaeon]|nr:hypothetical protein [Nitrososphaeraceae archaeon]
MEKSQNFTEFLRLGITIIYAIVIALSIDASKSVFVPFYSIPANLLYATVLFYGYFIILTTWIEYYFLTQKFHDEGKSGLGRFVLDLGILFLFYYIIIAGSNENQEYLIPDVYLFVTPLIFFLFTLKDMFRIRDYPNEILLKYRNMSRNFLFISIIISLSYLTEIYATGFQSFGSLAFYRDLIFAYLILALVVVYRVMRWHQFNLAVTDS